MVENMEAIQQISNGSINYKTETKMARGKFKPETRNLANDEIKKILLEKIAEEEKDIEETEEDRELLSSIQFAENKFNVVSLFSGAGGLDLGLELAGLSTVVGEDIAMHAFNTSKQAFNEIRKKIYFIPSIQMIFSKKLMKAMH